MNVYRSIAGEVAVSLTCADPAAALQIIAEAGIPIIEARELDALTVTFQIPRHCRKALEALTQRKGWRLQYLHRAGLYWTGKALLGRPTLLFWIALLLAASVYLPSRIFFVRVVGNSSVPTRLILAQAEACGIGFGASRREVRSQKMKDALLEAMPQLQWAGVNTSGCVATITVRERSEEPQQVQGGVSSIVAARDGVITQITATRGTARFSVGQAVRAGEVLISGYTDCGFCIRAQQADGEVFARTEREMTVVTPENWCQEGENQVTEKKYALIIGKNRINFYKTSRISGTTCDKMYSEYYVTLPGGFQLPVCIVTEVWTWSEPADAPSDPDAAASLLTAFADAYLSQQMTAGAVTERREEITEWEGVYRLTGNYACIEMIGRQRSEEIIKPNE